MKQRAKRMEQKEQSGRNGIKEMVQKEWCKRNGAKEQSGRNEVKAKGVKWKKWGRKEQSGK